MDREGCPQHYPKEPRQPRPEPSNPQGALIMSEGDQEDVLERITHQLENLTVNEVGARPQYQG